MHQDAPGLVGDVAKWIDACAVHPAPVLSTAAALACCSAIVGRRYTCQGARGVLYVVAVAKSGVGKDVGRRCATNLLEKAGIGERVLVVFGRSARHVIGRSHDIGFQCAVAAIVDRMELEDGRSIGPVRSQDTGATRP